MTEYICKKKCYHGHPGQSKQIFNVGDSYSAAEDEIVPHHFAPKLSPEVEAKLSEQRKFFNMLNAMNRYALIAYARKQYDTRFHAATGKKKLIEKITALHEHKMAEEKERIERAEEQANINSDIHGTESLERAYEAEDLEQEQESKE